MMTINDRLTDALQVLIDARLDTIDRMLVGVVPRQDRLDIGKEVEAQIFQLLEATGDEPTREDVLAVLARLDPPEAYLSEVSARETATTPRMVLPVRTQGLPAKVDHPGLAKASASLGIASLVMILLMPVYVLLIQTLVHGGYTLQLFIICSYLALTFVLGALGTILGVVSRKSGTWAIVGLSTNPFSIVFSLGLALLGLFI